MRRIFNLALLSSFDNKGRGRNEWRPALKGSGTRRGCGFGYPIGGKELWEGPQKPLDGKADRPPPRLVVPGEPEVVGLLWWEVGVELFS